MKNREKHKEKKKEKKKGKNKKAEKQLKKGKLKAEKGAKPGKLKESTKALRLEIQRLKKELELRDNQLKVLVNDQLKAPISGQEELTSMSEAQTLSQRLAESSNAGTISERKKIWERHQYLRSRYEVHLDAGMEKVKARLHADKDLRARYGDDAGYTEEQLDSILS